MTSLFKQSPKSIPKKSVQHYPLDGLDFRMILQSGKAGCVQTGKCGR